MLAMRNQVFESSMASSCSMLQPSHTPHPHSKKLEKHVSLSSPQPRSKAADYARPGTARLRDSRWKTGREKKRCRGNSSIPKFASWGPKNR